MKSLFIFVVEHLLKIFLIVNYIYYAYQPKGKKDENETKDDVPEYISKK